MKIISLRQPKMQVHVEDILRVESAIGDDRKKGTWIYLRDNSERRYCLETAKKVRQLIEEAKSKEQIQLEALAINLLKAARESADGRFQFTKSSDGLAVAVGGKLMGSLQGRDRSKYEYAEKQISGYALVTVESEGVYLLNERGYRMAEFFVSSNHPDDLPFNGFVKLPQLQPGTSDQIGIQINQYITGSRDVNNAISEKGNVNQSLT